MSLWRGAHILMPLIAALLFGGPALGQSTESVQWNRSATDVAPTILLSHRHSHPVSRLDEEATEGSKKFRTRQALILSGVAVSMFAYGAFAIQFNNSRAASEEARLAYTNDVRENGQDYLEQGIALDEIPSYTAWEDAWTDAANNRELLTLAGVSAFLLGLAAILDSATAGKSQAASSQRLDFTPTVGVSPTSRDFWVGARVGL